MNSSYRCPLCGCKKNTVCFTAHGFDDSQEVYQLYACRRCRLAVTQPIPGPVSINQYYSNNYYGNGRRKFIRVVELVVDYLTYLRAKSIIKTLPGVATESSPCKILDIGCGRAKLLLKLRDMGCECHGIERNQFPNDNNYNGLNIHRRALQVLNFQSGSFDAVVMWHVLEHLHEPFETMREAVRILKPGGVMIIAVPNFSSFQARWFKANWFHLDLPRHLYHFGVENLKQTLVTCGFSIRSVSTCSVEQNIFGFIQSCFNSLRLVERPNDFYHILKNNRILAQPLKLLLWIIASILVLPLALLEYTISGLCGRGASVIIFACKN